MEALELLSDHRRAQFARVVLMHVHELALLARAVVYSSTQALAILYPASISSKHGEPRTYRLDAVLFSLSKIASALSLLLWIEVCSWLHHEPASKD